jgi:hypothetical protein
MSRHFKSLTLSGLNDVWDEQNRIRNDHEKKIREAQRMAVKEANEKAEEAIRRTKIDLEKQLRDAVNGVANDTNQKLAKLDREHRERLINMANRMYKEIGTWTREQLDTVYKDMDLLQKNIDKRLDSQQRSIEQLHVNMQDVFDRFESEDKQAQDLSDFVRNLLHMVRQRTPVERFTPEQLEHINRRMRDLLNSQQPAASKIATADGLLHSILEMEEEATKLKIRHDSLVNSTRIRLETVLNIIAQNRNINVERNEATAQVETNFWTCGEYDTIVKRLMDLRVKLERQSDSMTDAEVQETLALVEEENQKAQTCMEKAIQLAIQSQNRAEISLDIVNAMVRQGYILKTENGDEAFDYMGGELPSDWREGFFAILQDPRTGDEISVTVMPDANGKDNDIAFHLNGEEDEKTERQYLEDLKRIREEIMKSGYELGEIEAPADGGNERMPQLESAETLRQAGTADKLRKRLRK